MSITNIFKKYKAAEAAMETHGEALEKAIKPLYDRYAEAMVKWDRRWKVDNDWCSIESVSLYQGKFSMSGTNYYRGCSESAGFTCPEKFIFGTDEDRDAVIAEIEAKVKERDDAIRAKTEAAERAQFEALKEKFG